MIIDKIKDVLDENEIQYSYSKETDAIYVQISDCEENIKFCMWANELKNTRIISIYIAELYIVKPHIRKKVKNYLLDYNTTLLLGAFGIKKGDKYIKFWFNDISTGASDSSIAKIQDIPTYLEVMSYQAKEIIAKIKEME